MGIKVLIVDDKAEMRLLLRKIVGKITGFEVVCEAESGEEAIEKVIENQIDLVFLDIEMSGLNGVEAAKSIISIRDNIKIIFATAYGEYMGSAFEVYAYDYLLKPFRIDRVFKTLDKFKKEYNYHEEKKSDFSEKIIIKNKDCNRFIDKDNVIFVERENGETIIYTENEIYKTSMSLSALEEKFEGGNFLRTHKSYIVNKDKIKEIYPYGRWTYIIKFSSGTKSALMTQAKYEILKENYR